MFTQKNFILVTESQREQAINFAKNVPLGIEVLFREPVKVRTPDQNSLMWSGALKDISEQAWHKGKQYSDKAWHETFKILYMPEDDDPNLAELVKNPETYRKWEYLPNDERRVLASTTQLTKKGFSEYLEQIYAHGSSMGVLFTWVQK